MKRILQFAGLVFTSILICACAPKSNPCEDILDSTWAPIFVAGTEKDVAIPDDPNRPVFIHFSKDLKVNGMAGVNNFFTSCQLKRKALRRSECTVTWTAIGSTRMAGPFLQYEGKFFEDIQNSDSIRLSANKLELLKGRKLMIEFKRIPNFPTRAQNSQ